MLSNVMISTINYSHTHTHKKKKKKYGRIFLINKFWSKGEGEWISID